MQRTHKIRKLGAEALNTIVGMIAVGKITEIHEYLSKYERQ